MGAQLGAALAKICELETRINNWNILLQKERNRTAVLERQLLASSANPARVTRTGTCGGAQDDYVDSLAACKNGNEVALALQECEVPMMTEDGLTGVLIGPTWLPSKVVLKTQATFSNLLYIYNIEPNNPPKCAQYAILEIIMTTGNSASNVSMVLPNGVEAVITRSTSAVIAYVPIVGGEVKLRANIGTTSTTRTLGINLIGFQ